MKPQPNIFDTTQHPCGGMTVRETEEWRSAQAEKGWPRSKSIHPDGRRQRRAKKEPGA